MEKLSDEKSRVYDEKWELRKKYTRLFQFLNSESYKLLNKNNAYFSKSNIVLWPNIITFYVKEYVFGKIKKEG